MKKVFLIGALALGMMSFAPTNQESSLDVGLNCFGVWTTAYNYALSSGSSHGEAVAYAATVFNQCVANTNR